MTIYVNILTEGLIIKLYWLKALIRVDYKKKKFGWRPKNIKLINGRRPKIRFINLAEGPRRLNLR